MEPINSEVKYEGDKRIMHPDVYDTLELMALMDDGIGARKDFYESTSGIYLPEFDKPVDLLCPICVWGAAIQADGGVGTAYDGYSANGPVATELRRLHIFRGHNDTAVRKINSRKQDARPGDFIELNGRVPFDEWTTELKVERGNAADFPELIEEQYSQPVEALATL